MIVRRLSCLIVLLLLMVIVTTVFAQDAAEIPAISIVANKEGVELPQDLSAGLIAITFENNTEAPFSPILARLNEGKTMADFTSAMQQPSPAAALEVVTLIGGLETAPDSSSTITYDLVAGDYIFINFVPGGPPDIKPFTVAEASGDPLEVPKADQVITLVDFAFALPSELKAGKQVWEITNEGEQFHEMRIMQVDEGTTAQEVTDALMEAFAAAASGPPGPPKMPYETALFWSPISTGMTAWIDVDLEPGTYAVICSLPDVLAEAGGPPTSHLQHGMITVITVSK